MPSEKERALELARNIRRHLGERGIDLVPAGIDPVYAVDQIDYDYAAAILRAQAEALERFAAQFNPHRDEVSWVKALVDGRVRPLHAAAAELEAGL